MGEDKDGNRNYTKSIADKTNQKANRAIEKQPEHKAILTHEVDADNSRAKANKHSEEIGVRKREAPSFNLEETKENIHAYTHRNSFSVTSSIIDRSESLHSGR